MEHIAVEWVVYAELDLPTNNYLIEEAKEMEEQKQSYSEEEVIKFGQWLSEFNNLDNESEYVIKKLLEQFKNK
jgi:hypothetical protein